MVDVVVNSDGRDTSIVHRMDHTDILVLGGEFIEQYYSMMSKCPSALHRFYKDDSVVMRESSSALGQKAIHETFLKSNLQGVRVGVIRLDAIRSNENSVLVQVCGEIWPLGSSPRRFMQTFTLREQGACDFYVLNDIFHYQDNIYHDIKSESPAENVNTSSSAECGKDELDDLTVHTDHTDHESPDKGRSSSQWPTVHANEFSSEDVQPLPSTREQPNLQPLTQQLVPVMIDSELTQVTAPDSTSQPRSWAQMASKPPGQYGSMNPVKQSLNTDDRVRGGPRLPMLNPRSRGRMSKGEGYNLEAYSNSQGPVGNVNTKGSFASGPNPRISRGGGSVRGAGPHQSLAGRRPINSNGSRRL